MTLILTHINQFGIIHASDSNLTGANNENVGEAQKTFQIPFLNAGLTVAGNYSVNGTRMNVWMTNFINTQEQIPTLTLRQFSETLRQQLENNMLPDEKENGSIIHIMGYVQANGQAHPEFWFVRNVHRLNLQTGGYENINENFAISEDFWTRDCPQNNLMAVFQQNGMYAKQIYINGFTAGRISYNIAQRELDRFFINIWRDRNWRFRPPQSLEETELIVKLYLQTITTLFLVSDYSAQFIGGQTQTYLIPQPENIVDHC